MLNTHAFRPHHSNVEEGNDRGVPQRPAGLNDGLSQKRRTSAEIGGQSADNRDFTVCSAVCIAQN